MARPSLLSALRRPRPGSDEEQVAPATAAARPRRAAPPPGQLRRERRALLRAREERIRDLGGLVLEMYRQDSFRESLLYEQCAEVASIEERLHELDALLAASVSARRSAPSARCACGAPLLWGSHFCANCGRSVGPAAVMSCASCGGALAADAKFCPVCGAEAPAAATAESSG